jgi:hypothetical protein
MEVVDPFAPAYRPDDAGHVDLPEQWVTPFPASTPEAESEPEPQKERAFGAVSFGEDVEGNGIERAKDLATQLSTTLTDLQHSLETSERERQDMLDERTRMQDRIRKLEAEAAAKERFKDALMNGPSSNVTYDDLQAMQSMTDALTQDPDRLTVLFNVVQQASKLATMVSVYTQLRRMAEES